MNNLSIKLASIIADLTSKLINTDVRSKQFNVLLEQLKDAISALQFMYHDETLRNIMFDTSSDAISAAIKAYLNYTE